MMFWLSKKRELEWIWEAELDSGEVIKQSENGVIRNTKILKNKNVKKFRLVSGKRKVEFELPSGATPVCLYLNYVFKAFTSLEKKIRLYCVGYEKGEEKKYAVILPGSLVLLSDNPEGLNFEYLGGRDGLLVFRENTEI